MVTAKHFTDMLDGVNIKALYNDKYKYKAVLTNIDGALSTNSIEPLSKADGFVVIDMPDSVVEAAEAILVEMKENMNKISCEIR